MGIFRITAAEFTKIFKKPSVYIMAMLLAIVIVASLFLFAPTNKFSYKVSITGTQSTSDSVSDVFSRWNASTTITDAKSNLDANITVAQNILTFYENLNTKRDSVTTALDEFLTERAKLDTVEPLLIDAQYDVVKTTLDTLINAYTDHTTLQSYAFYSTFLQTSGYKDFFNTDPAELGYLNLLLNRTSFDVVNFNSYFKSNDFENSLNEMNNNYYKVVENYYITQAQNTFTTYINLIKTSPDQQFQTAMESNRAYLLNYLQSLETYFDAAINTSPKILLMLETDYEEYSLYLEDLINTIEEFTNNGGTTLFNQHKILVTYLEQTDFIQQLKNNASNAVTVSVSEDLITSLNELISVDVAAIQSNIINDISFFVAENGASKTEVNKLKLNEYFSNYKSITLNTKQLVENEITLALAHQFSLLSAPTHNVNNTVSTFYEVHDFESFNYYIVKEQNIRINYLISSETFDGDYANVFSYNQNSEEQTNMFDFMYYALEIATVLIIIFAILMASNIMAYEYDSGTLKLLAIRPYKRYKILLGKMFAILFFVIVFVLFSAIIAGIGGYVYFPNFTLTPILAVFNAQFAFTINPIVLMALNLVSIIMEITFYIIIALSISVILRSFAGALSLSAITLLSSVGLNIAFGAQTWYSFLPFVNLDLFKFLGSASTISNTAFPYTLFSSLPLGVSSIYLAFGLMVFTSILVFTLGLTVFNKRDI